MRVAILTLLTSLVAANLTPDVEQQQEEEAIAQLTLEEKRKMVLANFKQTILLKLGFSNTPNMSLLNISSEQVQQRLDQFHAMSEEAGRHFEYYPNSRDQREPDRAVYYIEWSDLRNLQSAKLRFRDAPDYDVTAFLRNWTDNNWTENVTETELARVPIDCGAPRCHFSTSLDVEVRRTRTERSACGRDCCRRPFKINFKDIGMTGVIQPVDYQAYTCEGRCDDLLRSPASRYAHFRKLQSQVNGNFQEPELEACCVPRELKPLTIMYVVSDDPLEVDVKSFGGMVVGDCWCA